MKLIENARAWWKLWSIRLNAIGLSILAYVQIDPVGALAVWNMMPHDVRRVLPTNIVTIVGLSFFGLSMVARLVVQPKLDRANG